MNRYWACMRPVSRASDDLEEAGMADASREKLLEIQRIRR